MAKEGLEAIANMEYPGRLIIIGQNTMGKDVVVYAITGRSPSSQARKLVSKMNDYGNKSIIVEPTNEEELKKGNPDLLVYPAMVIKGDRIAVSNGAQTKNIAEYFDGQLNPIKLLNTALAVDNNWEYEPDKPNYTPRISGCKNSKGAALSIIKRGSLGEALRNYYEVPLIPGTGEMIATYTGENKNPLPSFAGDPLGVAIIGETPEEIAGSIYEALKPKTDKDFRVSVAAALIDGEKVYTSIINRHQTK